MYREHDLRLVVLAAVICALSSYTAISLLHHVRRSGAHMWWVWLAVAATSTGFGIWATHFIAMLAFSPGVATAYNIELTALSLIIAIVVTGLGPGHCHHAEMERRALAWRRHRWRRHRSDALHRHGGVRSPGPDFLGYLPGGRVDCARRGRRRRRVVRWIARRGPQMDAARRTAAHRGDLQPSLHRDGRRLGHS